MVVVEEAGAGAPLGGPAGDAGLRGDVGERAVAVVPEQDVRTDRGDVEIEEAVVVDVADRDAGLVGPAAHGGDSGLGGDVGERAVVIVVVQRVRRVGRAVDEVEILEAVVVVVERGDAGAEGLVHELVRRGAGGMHEGDLRPPR